MVHWKVADTGEAKGNAEETHGLVEQKKMGGLEIRGKIS